MSVAISSRYCAVAVGKFSVLGYENDAIKKGMYRDEAEKRGTVQSLNIFVIEAFAILL